MCYERVKHILRLNPLFTRAAQHLELQPHSDSAPFPCSTQQLCGHHSVGRRPFDARSTLDCLFMSTPTCPSSMTSIDSLDAFPAPPPLIGARRQVHFPPIPRVDFIVHFGHTDFHCHTFVLHIQSSYFRHVFDALAPSTSPLPPPPLLPVVADAGTVDEPKAAVELSPVTSPTTSPLSPPQPVWRSVLSTATTYMHSALQRLAARSERGGTKRKREAEEDREEESESSKSEEEDTTTRRAYLTAYTTASSPTSASSSASASSATDPTACPCAHPSLRCVHIPTQRTVISGEAITEVDFDLFLRHLYFCAHYRFPPFLPADDIHLTATPPPNITLPPYPVLNEQITSSLLRTRARADGSGTVKLVWKESLLTLAQYFDCAALLARCEAVGRRRLELVRQAGAYFDVLYAHQYSLREWKQRCIELILSDQRMKQRKEYALTALWEKQLLLDIIAAANERVLSGGSGKDEKRQLDRTELLRKLDRVVRRLHAQ